MNKIPTVDRFLFLKSKKYPSFCNEGGLGLHYIREALIEFAKIHVQAALEAADNNARVEIVDWDEDYGFSSDRKPTPIYGVDGDSILNAYPLSNIK